VLRLGAGSSPRIALTLERRNAPARGTKKGKRQQQSHFSPRISRSRPEPQDIVRWSSALKLSCTLSSKQRAHNFGRTCLVRFVDRSINHAPILKQNVQPLMELDHFFCKISTQSAHLHSSLFFRIIFWLVLPQVYTNIV